MPALQRCEGTVWKTSPAWTYSMMRATLASNCSRDMFASQRGSGRAPGWPRGGGTGPASRSRTSSITPGSPIATTVIVCLR